MYQISEGVHDYEYIRGKGECIRYQKGFRIMNIKGGR